MRDLLSELSPASLLSPAVYAADSTPNAVDLQGFNSCTVAIQVAAGGITFTGSNKVEFVLTHSDDDSTYSNVTDADVLGVTGITGGIVRSLIVAKAAADTAPTEIGYVGNKRYLKLLADFSGTHGVGTGMSALAIRGHAWRSPA